MTDTELKLRDTEVQLKLAFQAFERGDEDQLRSCINAVISNGRSVTFVMQTESHYFPKLAAWYREKSAELKTNPLMRFFNDKRVHSIPRGVVRPNRRTVNIEKIAIGDTIVATGGTAATYEFEGASEYSLSHNGNVFNLCHQYLVTLKLLVTEWLDLRASVGQP